MKAKRHNSLFYKFLVFLILVFLFISPLSIFADSDHTWYSIGHGPIEGELGYPIQICMDQESNILVLDGLKASVSRYNSSSKLLNAFPVHLPSSNYYSEIEIQTSLDKEIYIRVDNFLYIYSTDGSLLKTFQLNTMKGFIGNVGNQIAAIKDRFVVFKEQSQGIAWIGSIQENDFIARELLDDEGNTVSAIDIAISKESIYLLNAPYGDLRNSHATIYQFSHSGNYEKHFDLSNLQYFPTQISYHPDGYFTLFSHPSYYYIVEKEAFTILAQGEYKNSLTYSSQNELDVCSFSQKSILVCNPDKGIEVVTEGNNSIFVPICSSETISPYRITGDKINIFTFNLLSNTLSYYHNDMLKKSTPLNQILSLVNVTDFSTDVQLFIDNEDTLFIVIKGVKLTILRYNILKHTASSIDFPSYIPPKASVYYQPKNQKFFVLSWFDGILYSFNTKGEESTKLEISSLKNQPAFSSQSSICVDESGFLYILLPTLRKVRVIDSKGYLVAEFALPMEGLYSDVHLSGSILAILNSTNGSILFCTKRGEELFSAGENGTILYPSTAEGYQEKKGYFNYPCDIWCTEEYVYIADTGNSRIQILALGDSGSTPKKRITIVLQIGSKSAYIDNTRVELDEAPFTENGRTLVPFRFIGEALNAEILWDSNQKKASYILDGNRVDVVVGSTTAYLNGKEVTLDVPPMIKNGRTFVPIRFVTEALGASVIWEANTKKIYITYPGQ
jgi:sugar lactone lactonase YvrE